MFLELTQLFIGCPVIAGQQLMTQDFCVQLLPTEFDSSNTHSHMHLSLSKQIQDFLSANIWQCCEICIADIQHILPSKTCMWVISMFTFHTDHIYLQIGKAVQKMNDLSRPVYLKSMDEEKHKPNDVLWNWHWLSDVFGVFSVVPLLSDIFSLKSGHSSWAGVRDTLWSIRDIK